MSGAAAGVGGGDGGYGGLYHGDVPGTSDHLVASLDHDDGRFFQFQQMASPCAGDGDGGGTAPYASIADYLQGFLDPAGLAAHFGSDDAPPPSCAAAADDAVVAVKQEMVVQLMSGSRRDDDVVDDGQLAVVTPVTPANSSVLSSSSCEAAGAGADGDEEEEPPRRRCGKKGRGEEERDQEGEVEADDDAADRNCKRSKEKTTKKAREPRVAFMTKSEVDHLEDGYRWRKYGQKAVKNSTYPRSYYRCTAARCGVKKRVERSQQDPSTVITTYEGQHTHPSPAAGLVIRGYAGGARTPAGSFLPPLLPPGPGVVGGGGLLLDPSMRLLLLQEQRHHGWPAHSSRLGAGMDAYGGELDFIPSVPR